VIDFAGRRILVVSPHPDDETFGCAGLMAKGLAGGARVAVVIISVPESLRHITSAGSVVSGRVRRAEFEAAMDCLGVKERCVLFESDSVHMRLDAMPQVELVRLIEREGPLSLERVQPDVLALPAISYNQDHEAVWRAAIAACRPHLRGDKSFCPMVLAYDQPQLGWGRRHFSPNVYVDISDFLDLKLAAYRCYKSQVRAEPHHASVENVERLARLRGSEVAVKAAEAFECLRVVI
jgi:LmbE family N-acetylglucosaminyl deacetylase